MSRNNDDDLGGLDDLSDRQRWAVSRYQARQGRHQRDRRPLTNAEQWADFTRTADDYENERFNRS